MVIVSETNRVRAVREMAKKICNICNVRPVDRMAAIEDACVPCYEEGGWENAHQDNGHDELNEVLAKLDETGAVELRKLAPKHGVKNAGKFKSAELREMIRVAIRRETVGCWICFPELNEAQKVKKTRTPSEVKVSRKGQKINVPLRAPGELKAAVVIRAAGEDRVTLRVIGDAATLDVDLGNGHTLHLAWDGAGRYDYAEAFVSVGGKRKAVRNVAEALRIIKS